MSSGGELDGSASPLDRDSDPLDASESGSSGMVIRLRRLGDDGLTVVENAASMQQHALQSVKRQRTSESESQASAATGKFEYFVPSPQPSRNAVLHLGTGEAVDQWDHFPYSGPLLVGIKPEAPQFPMVVPSYSTWFSLDKVHPNEIRALPEFFPKDAEKYKKFRNFIVNAFRANPRVYLSATSCRKLIAADACAILRVHNFLESWGLINYLVDPGSIPVMTQGNDSTNFPVYAQSAHSGLAIVKNESKSAEKRAALPGLDDLISFRNDQRRLIQNLKNGISGSTEFDNSKMDVDNASLMTCVSCKASCAEGIHYMSKQVDSEPLYLCEECYMSGRLPKYFSSNDFNVKENSTITDVKGENLTMDGWSRDEISRLLDGIASHGEDWDSVSTFVGSKNKQQCVDCFLKLDLEDPLLEEFYGQFGSSSQVSQPEYVPFADAGNPIIAQVAFLASMVSPALAAAAAEKAIQASKDLKVTKGDEKLAKTPSGVGDVLSESMDTITVRVSGTEQTFPKSDVKILDSDDSAILMDADAVKKLAAESLAAAALKANELSEKEFKDIVSAVLELIQLQMKKIELKMKHFESMELIMTREKEHLEKCRQKLFAERLQLADARIKVQKQQALLKSQQPQGADSSLPNVLQSPISQATPSISTQFEQSTTPTGQQNEGYAI